VIQTRASTCRHHWLLSEPRQGVVQGVCKRCGARREYPACPDWSELYNDYDEVALAAPVGSTLRRASERLRDEED
jgi:hypothetical protein